MTSTRRTSTRQARPDEIAEALLGLFIVEKPARRWPPIRVMVISALIHAVALALAFLIIGLML